MNKQELKDEVIKIIKTDNKHFKKAVSASVKNELDYHDWLKKYLQCNNINQIFESEKHAFNYLITYIYHCMMLDGFVKENTNTSVVYFIRNKYNGLLKIGKTKNLEKRLTEIEKCFQFLGLNCCNLIIEAISYCPFGINNGSVESYYHNKFKDKRKTGEWFDVNFDTLASELYVDYVISDVLVTVEDIGDFPNKITDIEIENSSKEYFMQKIEQEILDKMLTELGIHDSIFDFIKRPNISYISAKDIYKYVTSLKSNKDTILDDKIEKSIRKILDFRISMEHKTASGAVWKVL